MVFSQAEPGVSYADSSTVSTGGYLLGSYPPFWGSFRWHDVLLRSFECCRLHPNEVISPLYYSFYLSLLRPSKSSRCSSWYRDILQFDPPLQKLQAIFPSCFSLFSIMFSTSNILARTATRTLSRRSFAAAADAAHRPPLQLHGLHARYANAVYTAASKKNQLDAVEGELLAIQSTASTSPPFAQFLENPLISRTDKEKIVTDMLKGKVTDVTLNLMTTLAGNARLSETGKIVDTYVRQMKAARGEVSATIISADPLTKAQTDAVASAMKNQVGKGKKVVLSTEVDPSILGGLQVQIGDQFLDLSVKSRIDDLARTPV